MGKPAKVVIFRHAEKPDDGPELSARGHQRAAALAYALPAAFGKPDFLLASRDSNSSDRPVETIDPLAKRLGLDVKDGYKDADFADAAEHLKKDKYDGKFVAICWHHGKIPELAAALGVSPQPAHWPHDVFDRYYVITYGPGGKAVLNNLPQKLLYQDSSS